VGELLQGDQRAILNFAPWPPGLNFTLGVNLDHMGEICPLGGMFTPSFTKVGVKIEIANANHNCMLNPENVIK
jgi:hypothetical protein